MEKTLLDPLTKGIPRFGRDMPKRNSGSYKYQDSQGRYFLGIFNPPIIPEHSSDKFYVLEAGDVARPDLLSYKMYKTPNLYWVILWMNGILDPFEGMYPGMLLRIPTATRLATYGIVG